MSAHALGKLDANERRTLESFGGVGIIVGLIAAVAGLAAAVLLSAGDWTLFGHGYLIGLLYFITVSIGALFFVILQHLTRAGWSVTIRRIAELMAMNLPLLGVLTIPVLILHGSMYEWTHAEVANPVLGPKLVWLNSNFFIVRIVLYFVVLSALAMWFFRHSTAQDADGDQRHTKIQQGFSGLCMMIFAVSFSALAFDLVMTLNPEWYSTIYAGYLFAGAVVGFFAWMILILRLLQSRGILTSSVNVEHYHDLGKWLFGFVFFWSYVAFAQYMLQWYAAIPEETAFFNQRGATTNDAVTWVQSGLWPAVSLILLFCHSLIPFAGLLSRWCKRGLKVLTFWALWMAVFHAVDLFWMIMPAIEVHPHANTNFATQALVSVSCLVGIGGLWVAGVCKWAGGRTIVAERDPRIAEALTHHTY